MVRMSSITTVSMAGLGLRMLPREEGRNCSVFFVYVYVCHSIEL